ncbi:unnamed protein product [Rotaria sp. Silwood2]|nr:unnamed protein product [Rotaria sp. Silwood2]CAF2994345.1 unnamed protein product [Rotaria sp. Silwood2]CAF4256362.1 unnamed protein product [Rotaria sp. Silwood2]CAF4400902.1 unnamed protein product [Rotaria sp. Silwood2]
MIQRLRFYQIPWSHYCDKVRWALDLKEIPYELINYNPFGKTKGLERAPKTMPKLMPMLEDPNNKDDNQFQYDSTPILIYLNTQYPRSSISLFPSSSEQHEQVIDICLRLDSTLGLYARRIAYVQILNESPNILSLVLREKFSWANNPDTIRSRLISRFVACFIIARYRVHRIREEQVREKIEQILLSIGNHLRTNDYLVGNQFSAADLTFCSLVKLLIRVPCFYDDRRFQIIFDYHERIRRNYDPKYPNIDNELEKHIDKHRIQIKKNEKSLTTRLKIFIHQINIVQRIFIMIMTMIVKNIYGPKTDDDIPQFKTSSSRNKQEKHALNDQRRINFKSPWPMMKFFFKYQCHRLFTVPNQAAYLNIKT